MDNVISCLRKYMPPLTGQQVEDITKEVEAIVRAKVKAEEAAKLTK